MKGKSTIADDFCSVPWNSNRKALNLAGGKKTKTKNAIIWESLKSDRSHF